MWTWWIERIVRCRHLCVKMRTHSSQYQTCCHTTRLSSSTSCYRRTRARVCELFMHSSSWIHSQTSTFVYNCSLVCSFTFAILAWQLEKIISGRERNEQLLNEGGNSVCVCLCVYTVRVVDMTIFSTSSLLWTIELWQYLLLLLFHLTFLLN